MPMSFALGTGLTHIPAASPSAPSGPQIYTAEDGSTPYTDENQTPYTTES